MDETTKQRMIEELRKRAQEWAIKPRQVGLSNGTPKGGWSDKDRVK
jgi:hypothetical protein